MLVFCPNCATAAWAFWGSLTHIGKPEPARTLNAAGCTRIDFIFHRMPLQRNMQRPTCKIIALRLLRLLRLAGKLRPKAAECRASRVVLAHCRLAWAWGSLNLIPEQAPSRQGRGDSPGCRQTAELQLFSPCK